jgi:gamma-glutamyltranspeptidase/glutathione hydrolase
MLGSPGQESDVTTVSNHSGDGAVAVTPHHDATAAALRVMGAGGTAADAVVAANAVLGMVLPTTCGIGGDLFALVHTPGMDRPEVLNASGRGGSGLDAAALRDAGHETVPYLGPESVSVPGAVDGWEALLAAHGRLSLVELLTDAIHLGTDGFEVSLELSEALDRLQAALGGQPSADALYPDGATPGPGTTLRRPDLVRTLTAIADSGREAFYSGPVANAIAAATGGIVTTEDLAANRPDWVDPIGLEVFGLRGWTVPPNTQGYLTLAALWLAEALGIPADPADPAFHHGLIEAYRAVAGERDDLVSDPEHAPWPPERLLDPARLADRLTAIDPGRATEWPVPSRAPGGTAYFCAMDANGMAVSCIQSNYAGIGSRVSAGTTGVFLHNRGAGFNLLPGHPNEAAPGKRPLHTLSPTLWTRGTDTAMILGTRGGHQQPQYLSQMAALVLHAGLDPSEAQASPRWHIDEPGSGGSALLVEPGMPEQVVAGLASRGHAVATGPSRTPGWGPVSVVTIDSGGRRAAAADPRVTTATAGGD